MIEKQPSSRSCFVCGRDNPAGLRARWIADGAAGEVRATVTLADGFQGFPGLAHGGVVTALLDEAMVRALLLRGGFEDLMVTARMEVTFRRATPTGQPVTVVGRVVKHAAARATAAAEVRLADGTVAARAEGLLLRQPPDVAAAWAEERAHWRVDD
ncbi:MAG TPA: PaaI family thioesterase [Anaeromyxobacteraceae bacterium]|nr:PaaI family thioesterase [Anaeromyxobacteraceae bacterium]